MMKQLKKDNGLKFIKKSAVADSHTHLYAVDKDKIMSAIEKGVEIIITNGVDTKSNAQTLALADMKNIFGMLGIHPEFANSLDEEEIEMNKRLILDNPDKIVGIGEIGLDYAFARSEEEKNVQKSVFTEFLDLAAKIRKPVSIHSRGAIKDVFSVLESYKEVKVHIHFFEGSESDARYAEANGYMISVPHLKSSGRFLAVKSISIDNLMVETDSPTAGAEPSDIYKAVEFVANAKGIGLGIANEKTLMNTKRFFNIGLEKFMRQGL